MPELDQLGKSVGVPPFLLSGVWNDMFTKTSIIEAFEYKKELGLESNFIAHPIKDNFFIQKHVWPHVADDLYCETQVMERDINAAWLTLDELVDRLQVQLRLKERAYSSTVRAGDS